MVINLLGQKLRVEILVLILIVGALIGMNLFCQCKGVSKESFSMLTGAPLNYTIGTGVPSSWENSAESRDSNLNANIYQGLEGNVGGPVPLPKGELSMFNKNSFTPECCPATYSSSTGCACVSPEQMKYLNMRGGNRTLPTMF